MISVRMWSVLFLWTWIETVSMLMSVQVGHCHLNRFVPSFEYGLGFFVGVMRRRAC